MGHGQLKWQNLPLIKFILPKDVKMIMMLNYRNMQVSILEVSRESIITLLNTLQYLYDSRNLESRYLCVVIKSPNIQYGS